jgi:DNA-binding NarL/FixJ family response regulator
MPRSLPLTPRERQVADFVARGWRNRRIAETLGITERTVKKHVGLACRKVGVTNRVELAIVLRTSENSARSGGS